MRVGRQHLCLPPLRIDQTLPWRRRSPMRAAHRAESRRGEQSSALPRVSPRRTCITAPSSSLNRCSSAPRRRHPMIDIDAAAAGEHHFAQRREQAAIGTIVIGEHLAVGIQLLDRGEKCAQQLPASSTSGAALPIWPYTCASAEPPRRIAPPPRSIRIKSVSPQSVRNCGVSVLRASATGANADTISDSGAVTSFFCPPSLPRGLHRHRILADRNADAELRAQFHADRAHGVVQRGILARMPGRRHPVGRQLDVADLGDRAPRRYW